MSQVSWQDLRQSPQYGKFMELIGWKVINLGDAQGFLKSVPFLPFSILKIQRNQKSPELNKFYRCLSKNRVFFTKYEPLLDSPFLNKVGFKKDSWPLSPSKTLVLDTTKSLEQILNKMSSKTRYNIKRYQKNQLKVNILQGNSVKDQVLKNFYQIWKERGRNIGLTIPDFSQLKFLKNAFESNFFFLGGYLKSRLLAGLIILKHQQTLWYWHNASTPLGLKNFAPTLLVWEAIKLSYKNKVNHLDFEGIYDPRYHRQTKNWQGFSRFKTSFGGQVIKLPGCYSRWFNPLTNHHQHK